MTDIVQGRVQRLEKVHAELRDLRQKLKAVEDKLETKEHQVLLAKERGELGGFQAGASNTKSRNAELAEYLRCDEDYQLLTQKAEALRAKKQELDDAVKEIKYLHGERMEEAGRRFELSVRDLGAIVASFEKAVDVYVSARKPPSRSNRVGA